MHEGASEGVGIAHLLPASPYRQSRRDYEKCGRLHARPTHVPRQWRVACSNAVEDGSEQTSLNLEVLTVPRVEPSDELAKWRQGVGFEGQARRLSERASDGPGAAITETVGWGPWVGRSAKE